MTDENLPIDPRLLGIRELVTMMLGRIEERVGQLQRSGEQRDLKLDSLIQSAGKAESALELYKSEDKAAHDKLSQQIGAINLVLAGESNAPGLIPRITAVERRMDAQRNYLRGALAVTSVISAAAGAAVSAVIVWLKK